MEALYHLSYSPERDRQRSTLLFASDALAHNAHKATVPTTCDRNGGPMRKHQTPAP